MKKLLGLVDLKDMKMSLGGLILFSLILKTKAYLQKSDIKGICFIINDPEMDEYQVTKMTKTECDQSVFFSTVLKVEGIKSCYKAKTKLGVEKFIKKNPDWYFYPSVNDLNSNIFHQRMSESTLQLQQFFKETKFIPKFKMDKKVVRWAVNFIKKYTLHSIPIVVHLKNNLLKKNCSNAIFDEWLGFFKLCDPMKTKFILIGNEEIDIKITKLPNVLVTKQMGTDLAQELALIEVAYAFMGMSSGPCNAAICSDVPYIIYKNPKHDKKAMDLEIGTNDHFPFALPNQKLFRIIETSRNLFLNFSNILSDSNHIAWKSRISYAEN